MSKSLILCLCIVLMSACSKSPKIEDISPPPPTELELKQQAETALLNDISGVWVENSTLITFDYLTDGNVHFIIDEKPIHVRLGDIDTDNETVNLIITLTKEKTEEIITLKRHWNEDKTRFTLKFVLFDGNRGELSFVRRIGQDDKNRIETIYARAANNIADYQQLVLSDDEPQIYAENDYIDHDAEYTFGASEQLNSQSISAEAENYSEDDAVAAAEAAALPALKSSKANLAE